jgi:hypothetical protein
MQAVCGARRAAAIVRVIDMNDVQNPYLRTDWEALRVKGLATRGSSPHL